ncbi:hypothetical protein CDD83_10427 [Cordyceps sp. RAO-2017]|nr:hypothetical protein CDD83_10427 [Cordyceps sp. RAO-2017]
MSWFAVLHVRAKAAPSLQYQGLGCHPTDQYMYHDCGGTSPGPLGSKERQPNPFQFYGCAYFGRGSWSVSSRTHAASATSSLSGPSGVPVSAGFLSPARLSDISSLCSPFDWLEDVFALPNRSSNGAGKVFSAASRLLGGVCRYHRPVRASSGFQRRGDVSKDLTTAHLKVGMTEKTEIVEEGLSTCDVPAEPISVIDVRWGVQVMDWNNKRKGNGVGDRDNDTLPVSRNLVATDDLLKNSPRALALGTVRDFSSYERTPVFDDEAVVLVEGRAGMVVGDAPEALNNATIRGRSDDKSPVRSWDIAESKSEASQAVQY